MLNDLITYVSIGLGLWMAWRYLRRSIRAVWGMLVSSIWGDAPLRSVELRSQTSRPQEAGIKSLVPVPVSVSSSDTAVFDLAAVPSNLTYEEIVTILARQVTLTGKPLYSGRKIYTLVGGNYNEFTALMRQLRSKDDAPAEPPASVTPIAKRPTRATFQESDPELTYHPPS